MGDGSNLPEPALDVVLEAGDAIFIPGFWFHHVEALGSSVSINGAKTREPCLAVAHICICTPPHGARRARRLQPSALIDQARGSSFQRKPG